jgi:cytochrome P450
MGLSLIFFVGVTLLAAYGLFRRQRQTAETKRRYGGGGSLVSYWPLEPFSGLDFQMKMHVDIPFLYKLHQRYGETFQVGTLISPPAVITIAKENLQAINTSKDFGVEPMRLPGMEYFCGRGFITSDGDTWSQSKKLLRPSFDRSNLKDLGVLRDEVNALINNLPRDGSTVDLQPLLYTTVCGYQLRVPCVSLMPQL